MTLRDIVRLVWIMAACAALAGCAATIVPPATVSRPAKVAVLDHGRHASLLLETPQGMVRYAYGEWEWYALGRTGAGRAMAALFLPTEATLGRRRLPGPLTAENAARQVSEGFEDIVIVVAEADRVQRLAGRLDALFAAGEGRAVHHPGHDLTFVPIPQSYSLGRNSNLVLAEWLQELGIRVDNPGVFSIWRRAD